MISEQRLCLFCECTALATLVVSTLVHFDLCVATVVVFQTDLAKSPCLPCFGDKKPAQLTFARVPRIILRR